uniref:Uncharacterized protein n=1 Tax=Ditylenchus dipsaci TaxID=166011 RepID=A0A915EX54_9BILA
MAETNSKSSDVRNKMGLFGAISYIIGNIVGSGIFITPTAILQNTSSVGLALVLWVASGAISMLGSFSYVELGTSIKSSGADFAYACFVEWYALAFCYMCIGSLVQFPAVVAIQAQTFSEYLFVGLNFSFCHTNAFFTPYMARKLVELCLISSIVVLNFFSLRKFVSRFNIVAQYCCCFDTSESTLGKQFTFLMPAMICLLLVGSLNATIFVSGRLMHAASKAASYQLLSAAPT